MTVPDLAIRGTIWASLLAWGFAEWRRLRDGEAHEDARIAWTLGASLAAVHVALAFHFKHAWSQAAAMAETARQTEEALGFALGTGIYANYAFVAVWVADVAWWWLSLPTFRTRPVALDRAVRIFILFIFANGAIVFPHGPVRVLGVVVMIVLVAAWYRHPREAPVPRPER